MAAAPDFDIGAARQGIEAWFDDIAAVQLPRVELSTSSPVNVLTGAEPLEIKVSIRDLAGEPLTGVLTLQDASGTVIGSPQYG